MLLLDTNVLSAIRKREPAASEWLSRIERGTSWISVVSLGEIAEGVAMKQRRDPAAADDLFVRWLFKVHQAYRDRIFDIDDQIALEWGRIDAIRTRGVLDGLIAATAIVRNFTLVTRNVADFVDTGAAVVNPWDV